MRGLTASERAVLAAAASSVGHGIEDDATVISIARNLFARRLVLFRPDAEPRDYVQATSLGRLALALWPANRQE